MRILTCLIGRVHMRSRVVNKLNADAKNGRVRDSSRCCRWDATRNLSAIGILQGEKDVARQIFWLLTSNCGENLLKYGWLLCVCTPVMNMLNRPNTTCVCVCVCSSVCSFHKRNACVSCVCVETSGRRLYRPLSCSLCVNFCFGPSPRCASPSYGPIRRYVYIYVAERKIIKFHIFFGR